MPLSVFDLFTVSVGPSNSHGAGAAKAAAAFAEHLGSLGLLSSVESIRVVLYGSSAPSTGFSHGTIAAIAAGLEGIRPSDLDAEELDRTIRRIHETGSLKLAGKHFIRFSSDEVSVEPLAATPTQGSGIKFTALAGQAGLPLLAEVGYSIEDGSLDKCSRNPHGPATQGNRIPFPFTSGQELLSLCERYDVSITELVMANESANRSRREIRDGVLEIHRVMQDCITRGIQKDGPLSATHNARRRAKAWFEKLSAEDPDFDPFFAPEWVNLVALAVTEENAAGGRVVTAPTNGAAGIIPAVLYYATAYVPRLAKASLEDRSDAIVRFFLTAAGIGSLLNLARTSIAEVEVGCQGEVRSATAMAAAGLAELLGGTPAQIETAAGIGMERTLGPTCDSFGGSFQAPCINHSAMASNTAIAAARMAVRGDGPMRLSFDEVLQKAPGTELSKDERYTEAADGDLAATLLRC